MDNNIFDYDVAFSFTALDEAIATELADLLADRLKIFIYSERQKEIAGTDGQESFSQVYGKTARLVVILYRPEWGQTRWTRVEMDAIKNRSLEDGWDFTVFIPTTDDQPAMPPWVPKTRLYVGLERWGTKGAAGVIEMRVAERGGQPQQKSVAERAARYARAAALRVSQHEFQHSDKGVVAARTAYEAFSTALEKSCTVIGASGVRLEARRSNSYRIVSGVSPVNLICHWEPQYSNNLDNCLLKATFYKGFPRLPGFMPSKADAKQLRSLEFTYELVRPERHAYIGKDRALQIEFSPPQLADHLLCVYLDIAEKTSAQ